MFMSKDWQIGYKCCCHKVLGAEEHQYLAVAMVGHISALDRFLVVVLGNALNEISCQYQMPVFPTTSPYVTSVGGTDWAIFSQAHQMSLRHGMEAVEGLAGTERPTHQNWAVNQYLKKMNSSTGFPPQKFL